MEIFAPDGEVPRCWDERTAPGWVRSSTVRSPSRSGSVPFVLRSRRIGLTLSSRHTRLEGVFNNLPHASLLSSMRFTSYSSTTSPFWLSTRWCVEMTPRSGLLLEGRTSVVSTSTVSVSPT